MNTEIEARLLNVDIDEFLKKLHQNNAEFIGDWLQLRYCYDFNPIKENSWVRLRTNGIETTLTIKEIQDSSISGTKESEIVVSDFFITDEILNKLGYKARSKQENRRIRYMLDNVEIDIDFWPMIPTYVEFEAQNEEQILNICKKLNIAFSDLVTLDVSSIYDHYGLNLKKQPAILTLENERKAKIYPSSQLEK